MLQQDHKANQKDIWIIIVPLFNLLSLPLILDNALG